MMESLSELFAASLHGRAARTGLVWGGQSLTFGEVRRRAEHAAAALRARGVRCGDRVAIYLPNGPVWIDVYIACATLGAIVVPVNVLYRDREVAHIVSDAEPVAIVAEGDVAGAGETPVWDIMRLLDERPAEGPPRERSRLREDGLEAWSHVPGANDAAVILYTSGTTGRPKGAVLTHANLAANARALLQAWRIAEDDRLLLTLPLFHAHGLANGLHCWLASGCVMRLEERFAQQHAACWFREFQPTVFFGVPTVYARLLEMDADEARRIGRGVRLFVSGSAPLSPQLFNAFEARFGHRILERYGMSETLMTLSNPLDGERRPGSVGLPLPGVEARVADDQDRPVPDGEPGELQVRGPAVFRGYWKREEAAAAAFTTDGWFRTGDIAEREPDGYVALRGRRSELIISGGFNIYPREIEDFLAEQPEIREAAVVGVPDPYRGELPVAAVVLEPGAALDVASLESRCRAHLASFKVPRRFIVLPALPRNAMGKVAKSELLGVRPGSDPGQTQL